MDDVKRFDGNSKQSVEERRKQRFYVHLQQDGGNPSQLLELLCLVVESEDWIRFHNTEGVTLTFLNYISSPYPIGVGWDREELLSTLKLKHRNEGKDPEITKRLEFMRGKVKDLLCVPLQTHGDKELGEKLQVIRAARKISATTIPVVIEEKDDFDYNGVIDDAATLDKESDVGNNRFVSIGVSSRNTNRNKSRGGTTETYSLQRLKRDAPEFYDKVINGEMKANKAMIESGLRSPQCNFSKKPEKLAETIRKTYDNDGIKKLIELLEKMIE